MRAWVLSASIHVLAGVATLIAWPNLGRERAEGVEAVPIDIVTIGPETDVRAIAAPQPPEPLEDLPLAEAPPLEEIAAAPPPLQPPPQRRPEPRNQPELNLSDLERQLLNDTQPRERPNPRGPQAGAAGERPREAVGRGAAETASLEAYFVALARSHIDRRQCWRDYADRPEMEGVVVAVQVRLARNGQIQQMGQARNIGSRRASQAVLEDAVRAARACAPYPFPQDPNGPPNFDLWSDMELTFGRDDTN